MKMIKREGHPTLYQVAEEVPKGERVDDLVAVILEGFTTEWKPIRRKLKGLAAYCVQHEVDHLDGVNIV